MGWLTEFSDITMRKHQHKAQHLRNLRRRRKPFHLSALVYGEYDQSGLAKRVAKAFDEAGFQDHQTVWIARTGTTVVLKGKSRSRTSQQDGRCCQGRQRRRRR